MADANVFQIFNGEFGLAIVDSAAVGYLDSWQAPAGKSADTVTLADYDAGSNTWKCQINSGALTASANLNTVEVDATWCQPAKSIPQPGETSYTFDITFLQDPNVNPANSLNRFLFEHDTEEAYVYAGMNGSEPPKLIGRCRLIAGTIGGASRVNLSADVSLPLSRKPDIEFGNSTDSVVIPGVKVMATGATAGTPGTWTPAGSTPPASVADLSGSVVATPAPAWTTGQYVQTGTAGVPGQASWDGTAWTAGAATFAAEDADAMAAAT